MITPLNPDIPVETPLGNGTAIFIRERGSFQISEFFVLLVNGGFAWVEIEKAKYKSELLESMGVMRVTADADPIAPKTRYDETWRSLTINAEGGNPLGISREDTIDKIIEEATWIHQRINPPDESMSRCVTIIDLAKSLKQ